MDNKKMAAGLLALLGLGVATGLLFFSKKNTRSGKNLLKKSRQVASELKGKFSEFVDQVSDKMQGVLK
jgi:hypothetical protein